LDCYGTVLAWKNDASQCHVDIRTQMTSTVHPSQPSSSSKILSHSVNKHALCLITLVSGLTINATTHANIEFARFLEFGATATDNPELSDAGSDPDAVLNIKPALEAKFAGNRFGFVTRAEVEYLRFADSEANVVDGSLESRIRGSLVDNLLSLDTSLLISRLSSDGNFLRLDSDESNVVAVFNATTSLNHSFGRTADLSLAHSIETLANIDGEAEESTQNSIVFSLERDPTVGRFIWGLGGFLDIDQSDDNDFTNSSAYAKVGGTLAQTLLAELRFGVESREFDVDDSAVDSLDFENFNFWEASLNWAPSEFTSLNVGFSERFFGSGPSLELKHRINNSKFIASFTREVTRQTPTIGGITSLASDPNLDTTISDTGSVNANSGSIAAPLDEPFVDDRFRLAYKLEGRRSDFIVDAVFSEQESLTGNETIDTLLGRIVFDRHLSDFLTLRLQYAHQTSDSSDIEDLNFDENSFAIRFIYAFNGRSELEDDDLRIE